MLNGISKLASSRQSPHPDAAVVARLLSSETDDEDAWVGTRGQRFNSFRRSVADMRHEMSAQMGPLGQHGFKVSALISAYLGVRVAHSVAAELGWEQAATFGAVVFAIGCAAGFTAQASRRHYVLSQGDKALKRMERYRDELSAAGTLKTTEAAFLAELEVQMAELRPFVQAQLIRRGASTNPN